MAQITQIPGSTNQSQTLSAINNNFRNLRDEQVTKIFKDASGVPTIIMGVLPDGTTGIVIAKPGVNVLTLF